MLKNKIMDAPNFTLIIDSREQLPLMFSRPSITKALYAGDYSVIGLENVFSCELKRLDDLASCCGAERERFFRELIRLGGLRFKRLVVMGTRKQIEDHAYRSKIAPSAVISTCWAIEARFNIPVVFCQSETSTSSYIETLASWIVREQLKIAEAISKSSQESLEV